MFMDKIGILTYHSTKNIGSSLQCFSLSKILESKNQKPVVIDYCGPNRKGIRNFVRHIVYYLEKILNKSLIKANTQFMLFENHYTKPYRDKVFNLEEKNITKVIVGGDQLWNPEIKHQMYFGGFDSSNKYNKYSYAVSFGVGDCDLSDIKVDLLKKFKMISVRESEGINILCKYNIDSKLCIDPALLNDDVFWKKCERKPKINTKDFIFCYFLKGPDTYSKQIIEYANKNKLEIIGLSLNDDKFINPCNIGPREFLWLVHHAKKVATNSYHCVIFSLIYHKDFCLFERFPDKDPQNENSRFRQLERYFDLKSTFKLKMNDTFNYDFSIFENNVKQLREDSLKYIDEIINDE